jgi:hypothetical protein
VRLPLLRPEVQGGEDSTKFRIADKPGVEGLAEIFPSRKSDGVFQIV